MGPGCRRRIEIHADQAQAEHFPMRLFFLDNYGRTAIFLRPRVIFG